MPVQKVSDFIIERVDCIYRFPQKLMKSLHYYILTSNSQTKSNYFKFKMKFRLKVVSRIKVYFIV